MKEPWEWNEDDLEALIRSKTKESIELEYKSSEALSRTDNKKKELSKDVSALANSAGGVIVYGIVEDGHTPVRLDDGFNPSDISKEWLLNPVLNAALGAVSNFENLFISLGLNFPVGGSLFCVARKD